MLTWAVQFVQAGPQFSWVSLSLFYQPNREWGQDHLSTDKQRCSETVSIITARGDGSLGLSAESQTERWLTPKASRNSTALSAPSTQAAEAFCAPVSLGP